MFSYKSLFIEVFYGDFLDLTASSFLRQFFYSIGCSNIFSISFNSITSLNDFRFLYQLNSTLIGLESCNNYLFLGTNLRLESPLLNSRIRKSYLTNFSFSAYSIGLSVNYLTYPVCNLGNSIKSLIYFFSGKLSFIKNILFYDFYNLNFFSKYFFNLDFFIGSSFLNRIDGFSLVSTLLKFFSNLQLSLNNLHFVYNSLGVLSGFEYGLPVTMNSISCLQSGYNTSKSFIYFIGVDFDLLSLQKVNAESFLVYHGSFLTDKVLNFINLILPMPLYTEKSSLFLNLEGRLRKSERAISTQIKSDSLIFESLIKLKNQYYVSNFSIFSNFSILVNFFAEIINYSGFWSDNSTFYLHSSLLNNSCFFDISFAFSKFIIINTIFSKFVINYYNFNEFTKLSKNMRLCSLKLNINILNAIL